MNLRNILVATDLDDSTEPIYRWALHIARVLNAEITLVHVDQLGATGFHDSSSLNTWLSHFHRILTDRIEQLATSIEEAGVPCRTVIRQGHPVEELLDAIETEDADLLIIAKRGEGALSRFIVGSTTRKLLRGAAIPILVVDIGHAEDVKIERILTTTDLSRDSDLGLGFARDLAVAFGATLDAIHVFQWPLYIPHAPGHPTTTLPPTAVEELRRYYETELDASRAVANETGHSVVVDPDVAHGILAYAHKRKSDLLIIPSHGKGTLKATVLGSTSERTVEATTLPVLVLPRAWLEATEDGAVS